ncbi:hypothetical protein DGG96_19260 [Legionella qingyii]|uniref:Uncharacterized protein n=1 Tax=Legionella qingyii TaxID=2184757 RepID=A0A317TX65_9GAMM|nr:hypothetical protein DGG96_19260 [Legionella qingyii]
MPDRNVNKPHEEDREPTQKNEIEVLIDTKLYEVLDKRLVSIEQDEIVSYGIDKITPQAKDER